MTPARELLFVHINKTGGSSVEAALGLPFRHRTARWMRRDVGARRWDRALTFAIVRNPWDRAVSLYHWRVRTNQTGLAERPVPFRDWVRRCFEDRDPALVDKPLAFAPQIHWLKPEDPAADTRLLVRRILRHERLEADFARLCDAAGIRPVPPLPRVKASGRDPDHRRYYCDRAREAVGRAFAEDAARFGYGFDPA